QALLLQCLSPYTERGPRYCRIAEGMIVSSDAALGAFICRHQITPGPLRKRMEVVMTVEMRADPCRWGMAIPFAGVPLHEHRGRLEELDELGYSGVWTGEASS